MPPPAGTVALTIVALLVVRLSRGAREAVQQIGPGPLVLFHVVELRQARKRLVLEARDMIPRLRRRRDGDIVVGIAAIWVLLQCLPVRTPWQRWTFYLWNVADLLDILAVIGNAIRPSTSGIPRSSNHSCIAAARDSADFRRADCDRLACVAVQLGKKSLSRPSSARVR